MEEEVEDIVGEVILSDSQKSFNTSNVYSMDFTDSNSDKHNSSSKETYVIDLFDSEDSEMYPLDETKSVVNIPVTKSENVNIQCQINQVNKVLRTTSTSIENCSIVQETFTQTSKTIFELAQAERDTDHLETQTSFVSVTENKTFEYRIEVSKTNVNTENVIEEIAHEDHQILSNHLEDESSKYVVSDGDTAASEEVSESPEDRFINIINDESKERFYDIANESRYEDNSDFEDSDSDFEEDSLMETRERKQITDNASDTSNSPNSVDGEIEELYNKLSESIDLGIELTPQPEKRVDTLTPLTEESTIKKSNVIDITPNDTNFVASKEKIDEVTLFMNDDGFKVKMLPMEQEKQSFKLPPIQNTSCPNSPHLNFLFSLNTKLNKSGTMPCLHEDTGVGDSWEVSTNELAAGEHARYSARHESIHKDKDIHLPPIHLEGYVVNGNISRTDAAFSSVINVNHSIPGKESININEKIKELKMNSKVKYIRPKYNNMMPASARRSGSPCSEEVRISETAERGCDALSQEMLKKLRSNSWFEVMDTLDEIPKTFEKFWNVISEQRIADLVRQVSVHVESPRTQVARSACNTLAAILKNTNYTKKPDFYEAITLLLTKTGSFSRPVRRAANLALDEIVCAVDISHAITALCIHGTSHKSGSVRSAAARLLVVCCGVRGGRGVLRARPPSAAAARRHALRALAALLDDKNTDARKYAERLYLMLRTNNSFEAYYLTDVDVEVAARQMKKYDKLLFNTKESR